MVLLPQKSHHIYICQFVRIHVSGFAICSLFFFEILFKPHPFGGLQILLWFSWRRFFRNVSFERNAETWKHGWFLRRRLHDWVAKQNLRRWVRSNGSENPMGLKDAVDRIFFCIHPWSLTASLPLTNDDWKTTLSYWDSVTFQGRDVKLREGNWWFGARWFGIRIGIPLFSTMPFIFGNPKHGAPNQKKLTISWARKSKDYTMVADLSPKHLRKYRHRWYLWI